MKMRQQRAHAFGLLTLGLIVIAACRSTTTESVAAPGGAPEAADRGGAALQWSAPPAMEINPSKTYEAVLGTEIGEIRVRLFAERAPVTVNNFVFLARQGFYDNTTFHRVLPGFMAQAGDPTGTGVGGPGYTFGDEIHPDLQFDRAGLLAMANRGPDTNGSQFFLTFAPTPQLNGVHTIFGEVVEGMQVLTSLRLRDPLQNPNYPGTALVTVEIIAIAE